MVNGLYNGLENGLQSGVYDNIGIGLHNGTINNEIPINKEITKDGLVLYLDARNPSSYMPSTTKWNDLSGNGLNTTIINGVTYNNGSLLFDGINDYINLGSSKFLSLNTSFTFCCWLKKQIGGNSSYQNLFVPAAGNFKINIAHKHGGGILFYSYNDSYLYVSQTSPINIFDNKWHFLCFTVKYSDLTTWKVYVDEGIKQNNLFGQGTSGLAPTLGTSYIGGETSESQYMFGSLGLVLLYNRILNREEIINNYNILKLKYII